MGKPEERETEGIGEENGWEKVRRARRMAGLSLVSPFISLALSRGGTLLVSRRR